MPFCTCFLSMSNAISGVASASFYVQHTVHDEIAVETGSKLSGGVQELGGSCGVVTERRLEMDLKAARHLRT